METYREIALGLGAFDVLKRLDSARFLTGHSATGIAFVGSVNSGKTTLINGILGQEVRKASLIPYEGKPLRVGFSRMDDDDDYDCAYVFHEQWSRAEVVIYEFTAERLFEYPGWLDVVDVIFYLSPLSHFMTAEDKTVIDLLKGLPIQVVGTRYDEMADEDREKYKAYAQKACERMGLTAPIIADAGNWQNVSAAIQRALPLTMELNAMREQHQAIIESVCKDELVRLLHDEMQKSVNELEKLREEQAYQRELAMAAGSRAYQELRLTCSSASNDTVNQVRQVIQDLEQFSHRAMNEGQQSGFSEAFKNCFMADAQAFFENQLISIRTKVNNDLVSIVNRAVDAGMLTESESALLNKNVMISYDGHKPVFGGSSGQAVPYLLQSLAGVGVMGVAAWALHAPSPLTAGVIAASTAIGGVSFYQRNAAAKTAMNENTIQDWFRSCAAWLQNKLTPEIQTLYANVSNAIREPEVKQAEPGEAKAYLQKVERLQAFIEKMKG